MIVQPCTHLRLSPSPSPSPCRPRIFHFTARPPAPIRITCSVSQSRDYGGTVDYEKASPPQWIAVCRQISLMARENPNLGSAAILNQWELQTKPLTKSDVSSIVKSLRKYNLHSQALEVYGWMSQKEKRFTMSSSDAAIQLDLIAKVCGIPSAEDFFHRLPENVKDNKIYGALLNSYVRAEKREEAESLIEEMRLKGYTMHSLPFNVMMTLYMKLKDYAKVESMVLEMTENNIQLDLYSYNIWISCCGSQCSIEKMEQVFEQMKLDDTVYPDWTTFSTMATTYIKAGQLEKAEKFLRKVEGRIKGRGRIPYHYLLSLYGSVGKKNEVLRVWDTYKSTFPTIPYAAYHSLIHSLIKVGDVSEAEKIYEEWLVSKTYYDARIANLFMTAYIIEGNFEKAENFFKHMVQEGGNPTLTTWKILAEVYIGQKKIHKALSCLREAFAMGGSKSWRLKAGNISALTKLCEEEGDAESKEILSELLKQTGHHKGEGYASNSMRSGKKDGSEYDESEEEEDGYESVK